MTGELPLIGRDPELARIGIALRDRQALLIFGPPGSGKSRLIDAACDVEATGNIMVRVTCPEHPHELLVNIARELLKRRHPVLMRRLRCALAEVPGETSVHLRGVLWTALTQQPCSLIIEDVCNAGASVYRFLWPLCHTPGMSVIVTTVSPMRLGYLHRLIWDTREHLELKPLHDRDSQRLASLAADQFQLPPEIDRADLQDSILKAAEGNPGRIIEMYRLAADSRYHRGGYVKMALIQIDLAARFTV